MAKVNYPIISYKYYCNPCSYSIKRCVDFDERLEQFCPKCGIKMKYLGGTPIAISSVGNCGYKSAEKQSQENIRSLGRDAMTAMENADPIVASRKKQEALLNETKNEWWRKIPGCENPLDLDKIKDKEKFIMTGDKT